jgi:hypothetical protein
MKISGNKLHSRQVIIRYTLCLVVGHFVEINLAGSYSKEEEKSISNSLDTAPKELPEVCVCVCVCVIVVAVVVFVLVVAKREKGPT